jgi:hypothetical protein
VAAEGDGERLDEQKLEILRGWGQGLAGDARDEVRAAGKAIVLLIGEIERLHIELWHARDTPEQVEESTEEHVDEQVDDDPVLVEKLEHTLQARMRTAISRVTPHRGASES